MDRKFLPLHYAREYVRKLGLSNEKAWRECCKSGKKPKEIPSTPNIAYRGKGWKGWPDFLGIWKTPKGPSLPRRDPIRYVSSKSSRFSRKHVKSLYEEWLLEKARSIFEQKTRGYCMELSIKPPQVIIKNLKNRWGSFTKHNVMNLNLNLAKTPESVIDYIILHELCHLKIKEHSHHFWDMLHKFMPDYQDKVKWLRINGNRLV